MDEYQPEHQDDARRWKRKNTGLEEKNTGPRWETRTLLYGRGPACNYGRCRWVRSAGDGSSPLDDDSLCVSYYR